MPPPSKKRKTSATEEVTFDPAAREEYLTGFHKRKQARIKYAQEQAAKKEREERILERKKVRLKMKATARLRCAIRLSCCVSTNLLIIVDLDSRRTQSGC
jgi:hypothetical protein